MLEAADTIGGGARSAELTLPGLLHDDCSAAHPMAVGVPFLRSLGAGAARARVGLAGGRPGPPARRRQRGRLLRSIDATAAGLGEDGARWRAVFGPPAAGVRRAHRGHLAARSLHLPRHPLRLTRFGLPRGDARDAAGRAFETPEAKALFGGVAAHAFSPLNRPMSSSVGHGADLRLPPLRLAGGAAAARRRSPTRSPRCVVESRRPDRDRASACASLDELPDADAVVLDLAPRGGGRRRRRPAPAPRRSGVPPLPARPGRLQGRPRGRGRRAVDRRAVPAGRAPCTRSARSPRSLAAERDVNRGRMPERPFVLVGQQYLADPSRSDAATSTRSGPTRTCRSGYDGDATEAILGQLERFAPGLRERIVATPVRSPAELEAYNAELRGRRHHHRRQHAAARSVSARASRSTPTRPAIPGSTSARRRPRPARERTG